MSLHIDIDAVNRSTSVDYVKPRTTGGYTRPSPSSQLDSSTMQQKHSREPVRAIHTRQCNKQSRHRPVSLALSRSASCDRLFWVFPRGCLVSWSCRGSEVMKNRSWEDDTNNTKPMHMHTTPNPCTCYSRSQALSTRVYSLSGLCTVIWLHCYSGHAFNVIMRHVTRQSFSMEKCARNQCFAVSVIHKVSILLESSLGVDSEYAIQQLGAWGTRAV